MKENPHSLIDNFEGGEPVTKTTTAVARISQRRIDDLFAKRRFAYYVPEDSYVEGCGYRVSIVFERESGHFPTGTWPYEGKPGQTMPWFWGHDLAETRAVAEEQNAMRGISAREAAIIVLSSIGRSR